MSQVRRYTRALLRRLRRDTRGATAVEFGMIAMPFLAIILAIFEVAYVHVESELLSGAVSKAARSMLTGVLQTSGGVTNSSEFVNRYLCPANGPRIIPTSFDCTKLVVDVRTVAAMTDAQLTNDIYKSQSTQFCPGRPGDYVVMRVTYPLPAILPLNLFSASAGTVSDVPNAEGRHHILLATALFREENFAGAYTSPKGC